jgi:hypothetical protein
MTDFAWERPLVDAFVAGTLDPQGEAVLADEVARILPYHWSAPNPIVAELTRMIRHLGSDRALLDWLDRHPGRPRTVARLYLLIALLDRFSDEPAVVTALRELRERQPYPPGLAGHLVPDTDGGTLANLAAQIESMLGEDRIDEVSRLAVATTAMLEQVAARAAELDADVRQLGDLLDQVRREFPAAATKD